VITLTCLYIRAFFPFWRGLLKVFTAFASGIHIAVGNGRSTRFWLDDWVGNDSLAPIFFNLFGLARGPSLTVISQTCLLDGSMIWAPHFRIWPNQLIRANIYNDLNFLLILLQPLHLSTLPDVRQLKLKQDGIFTVNSLYRKLTGYREENNCFRWIWTTQAPLKIKVHM